MSIEAWQAELAAIRAAHPVPWGRLVRPSLVVLPRWAGWLRGVTGGAFVWWAWICIDARLLEAPPAVRRYVLAHEWGHVARGHLLVGLGAFFLVLVLLAAALAPPALGWSFAGLAASLGLLGLVPWMGSIRRELEADAFAATVAPGTASAALRWLVAWSGTGWSAARRRRLETLRQLEEQAPGV